MFVMEKLKSRKIKLYKTKINSQHANIINHVRTGVKKV